ncbi:MAG: hypothetical protein OEX02_16145, partial [Cyclobacteriaceae bacterium]|nr:hypothetical protein [Cyclobacteriaceae bacterium]
TDNENQISVREFYSISIDSTLYEPQYLSQGTNSYHGTSAKFIESTVNRLALLPERDENA